MKYLIDRIQFGLEPVSNRLVSYNVQMKDYFLKTIQASVLNWKVSKLDPDNFHSYVVVAIERIHTAMIVAMQTNNPPTVHFNQMFEGKHLSIAYEHSKSRFILTVDFADANIFDKDHDGHYLCSQFAAFVLSDYALWLNQLEINLGVENLS